VTSTFLAIPSLHTKILEGGATHHNNVSKSKKKKQQRSQGEHGHLKRKTMMTTLIARTLSSLLFFPTNQNAHERRQDPTMMTLRPKCTQTINNNASTTKRR
jgi:hypothetical protein